MPCGAQVRGLWGGHRAAKAVISVVLSGEISGLFVGAENNGSGGSDRRRGLYAREWGGTSEQLNLYKAVGGGGGMAPVEYSM